MLNDDACDLTPENRQSATRPRGRRYRQIFTPPSYSPLIQIWNETVRRSARSKARSKAISQARSNAIDAGDTDLPTEPTSVHIDWWERTLVRNYKKEVKKGLAALFHDRGLDETARRRMKDRNRKLAKSAAAWQAGDRSPLYNTSRKLMSPEERAAHDREKARLRQQKRRAKKRRPNPNYGRF